MKAKGKRKGHARCALNILVCIIMMHNRIADELKKNKRLKSRINNIRNQIFKIDVTLPYTNEKQWGQSVNSELE
ncbi:MAG: hypothetical protein AB1Z31_00620 [Desulfobacterales bacterium]